MDPRKMDTDELMRELGAHQEQAKCIKVRINDLKAELFERAVQTADKTLETAWGKASVVSEASSVRWDKETMAALHRRFPQLINQARRVSVRKAYLKFKARRKT